MVQPLKLGTPKLATIIKKNRLFILKHIYFINLVDFSHEFIFIKRVRLIAVIGSTMPSKKIFNFCNDVFEAVVLVYNVFLSPEIL